MPKRPARGTLALLLLGRPIAYNSAAGAAHGKMAARSSKFILVSIDLRMGSMQQLHDLNDCPKVLMVHCLHASVSCHTRPNYNMSAMQPPGYPLFRGNSHSRGNIWKCSGERLQSCSPRGAAGAPLACVLRYHAPPYPHHFRHAQRIFIGFNNVSNILRYLNLKNTPVISETTP